MLLHLVLPLLMMFSGGPAPEKHIVFLISEDPDNYEAPRTVPRYAELLRKQGYKTTVLLGEGEPTAFHFPGLEEAIGNADLVVVFCRRVALPESQMRMLKNYLAQGNPLVGIRTAHHSFSPRETIAKGHEGWPEFPADILGCENKGYGPLEKGYEVRPLKEQSKNSLLKGVSSQPWHSEGSLYHVQLLDSKATVVVQGQLEDKVEPIAWSRITPSGSRVFYTSLGYPSDFERDEFLRLLNNGIRWATGSGR